MSGAPLHCAHFARGECTSCGWWGRDYADQLAAKQADSRARLSEFETIVWESPATGPLLHFRNKAKLAVGGTLQAPTLGFLDEQLRGVDLPLCRLYEPAIDAALPAIRAFIDSAGLHPYDAVARTGELKYVLLTAAPDGGLMLRWVLRSREAEGRIRRGLSELLAALPGLRVVSINLQPKPAALIEGSEEILLHGDELAIEMPRATLFLRPGGFFQTHTLLAGELYETARQWTTGLPLQRAIDLYCGIGGFALHLARPGLHIHGYEISSAAVDAATRSAAAFDSDGPVFVQADASALSALVLQADLLVVNPPRRGIGANLCAEIEASGARWLLYSSCNPQSLAADLARMPALRPHRARLFDLFPHTPHAEVMVLAERAEVAEWAPAG